MSWRVCGVAVLVVFSLCFSVADAVDASSGSSMLQSSIGLGLEIVPQISAVQEYQRRLGDLYNGIQAAFQFRSMATLMQKADEIEDGAVPMAAGVNPLQVLQELQNAAAVCKFSALKHIQLQIACAASDVDKAYWNNQLIADALPQQLLVFKLYSSYLNVYALGLSLELHDAFTLEAILDNFNGRFGYAAEFEGLVAQQTMFQKWMSLVTLKLQLHVLDVYETITTQQLLASSVPAGSSVPFTTVLLEEGLKMESTNGSFASSSSSFGTNTGSSIPLNFTHTASSSSSFNTAPSSGSFNFTQTAAPSTSFNTAPSSGSFNFTHTAQPSALNFSTSFGTPSSSVPSSSSSSSASFGPVGSSFSGSVPTTSPLYGYALVASKVLRIAAFIAEMQVAYVGLTGSSLALKAYALEETTTAVAAGEELEAQADKHLRMLPSAYLQWTNVQLTRFMVEYFVLYIDTSAPAQAPVRIARHAEEAILDTNFVQTH